MEILTCVEINRLDDRTGFLNPVPEEYQIDEKDIAKLHKKMLEDENVISYKVYNSLREVGHDGLVTEEEIENTQHTYWIADEKRDVRPISEHKISKIWYNKTHDKMQERFKEKGITHVAVIWSYTVELTDKETVFLRDGTTIWSKTPREKQQQELDCSVSNRQHSFRKYLRNRKP